ncbi:MAG: hypothetical protein ACLUVC_14070 [Longibaculum sp.]
MTTNDKIEVMFYSNRRRVELTVKQVNPTILVDERGKEYFYKGYELFESNDEDTYPAGCDFDLESCYSDLYDEVADRISELDFEQLKKVYEKINGNEYRSILDDEDDEREYCEEKIFEDLQSLDYDGLAEVYNFILSL